MHHFNIDTFERTWFSGWSWNLWQVGLGFEAGQSRFLAGQSRFAAWWSRFLACQKNNNKCGAKCSARADRPPGTQIKVDALSKTFQKNLKWSETLNCYSVIMYHEKSFFSRPSTFLMSLKVTFFKATPQLCSAAFQPFFFFAAGLRAGPRMLV